MSFELAGRRLGAEVVNLEVQLSSRVKGESMLDTIFTLQALHFDVFVIRDAEPGVLAHVAAHVAPRVSVLSAGEAHLSHPTQGLLDALTIRQHKGEHRGAAHRHRRRHPPFARRALGLSGLSDAAGTRDAHRGAAGADARAAGICAAARASQTLEEGLAGVDVVMMLRIQKERFAETAIPDGDEYFARYGLTPARLARARADAIVMHPQPMNRGIEIASEIADGPQSVIRAQVSNGVAVRMARARDRRRQIGAVSVAAPVNGAAAAAAARPHRGTIMLEDAPVLAHTHFDGEQHVLRLQSPRCAARATPGSFVHLRCAADLPMRRPLSIMRADAAAGWIEVLYKVRRRRHARAGPRGAATAAERARARSVRASCCIRSARACWRSAAASAFRRWCSWPSSCAGAGAAWKPLVLMGSEMPFPFRTRPSTILVPGMPDAAIACMPLLEEWGVPSRLATLSGFPGCFDGYVTELARAWLRALLADRARRDRNLRLRPDADARRHGPSGARILAALPGRARGIHGVRGRRLRRLRGGGADAGGARDEARVRRWPRIRGQRRLPG